MQANNPDVLLTPSQSWVSRDYALMIVQQLRSLLAYSPVLFDSFVFQCRSGYHFYSSPDYVWLVLHSLVRDDSTIESRVSDIVTMTVSGDYPDFTIDGTVFG